MSSVSFVSAELISASVRKPQQPTKDRNWSYDEENLVPSALMSKDVHLQGDGCAIGIEDLSDVHNFGDRRHPVFHDPLDSCLQGLR